MRRILIIIALVILSNPIISNVDILPDFIAYSLILIALSKTSYYDQKSYAAQKCAKNMLFVSGARLLSIYISTMIVDDTISLLCSFTFFVLELVFGIPFLIKFIDYSTNLALQGDNIEAIKRADRTKIVLIVLFVVRLLLSTAPDFVLLTMSDPISMYQEDLTRFRPVLILFSVVLSTPVMVAWLALGIKFFIKIFTKQEAERSAQLFIERVKHKDLQFNISAHKFFFIALGIFSLAIFEPEIDNKTIIFNSFLPLAFIAIYVFLFIRKHIKFDKLFFALVPISVAQLIASLVVRSKQIEFFKEYTLLKVFKISAAETMYYAIPPYILISSILFVASFLLMLYLFIKNAGTNLFEFLPGVLPRTDMEYARGEYKKKVMPIGIVTSSLCALSTLISPVVFMVMPMVEEFTNIKILGLELVLPLYSSIVAISYVLRLAFVVAFVATIVVVNENSYRKLKEAISLD